MKSIFLTATVILTGLTSLASAQNADAELEAKKVIAKKLVSAASSQAKSEITAEDAYRLSGKIIVLLTESYTTKFDGAGYADEEESSVMCRKSVEFSTNPEDNRLNVIKLIDGLCFL